MDKFFAAVRNMFNVPDLRRRILFTLGMLAVYRLGAHIGAPGINKDRLDQVWHDVAGTLLGVLDLFSGGNFRTISIFALGVTPYITASIILQLMTVVYPALKKLQEEGEMGRQKINQWTRYLTVGLAAIQTSFVAHWLQVNGVGADTWGFLANHGAHVNHRHYFCHVAWRADHRARRWQRYFTFNFCGHRDWPSSWCAAGCRAAAQWRHAGNPGSLRSAGGDRRDYRVHRFCGSGAGVRCRSVMLSGMSGDSSWVDSKPPCH